jgi:hypothetical protein
MQLIDATLIATVRIVKASADIGVERSTRQQMVRFGRRNYGDHDKGLAPLSLCESR